MEVKPIKTEDGSHSLYVPQLDEHYHSTKGAIQESKHIFINSGLHFLDKKSIRILEIGFGTGLNAFFTLLEANKHQMDIAYVGIEKYPLKNEITSQLNYPKLLSASREYFDAIHQCKWGEEVKITVNFLLQKIETDLAEWNTDKVFDLIYFDAFGPDKQPEMWTSPIFQLMGKCLTSGGVLVTYSAKGDVRRGLQSAGMEIQKIPGPAGKKHITRAIKI